MNAADYDDRLTAYVARFREVGEKPLLSFVQDGAPFSIPCVAEWVGQGEFHLTTKWPSLRASDPARSASLLWHYHDAEFEDQYSMVLQGWLRADGEHTVFRLAKQPDTTGLEPVDEAEMYRNFDRKADKYLADHALQPPVINQTAFEALAAEVRAEKTGRP